MTIPNTITLDALRHMAVGDIAALPAEDLARLQADADAALRDANALRDWCASGTNTSLRTCRRARTKSRTVE